MVLAGTQEGTVRVFKMHFASRISETGFWTGGGGREGKGKGEPLRTWFGSSKGFNHLWPMGQIQSTTCVCIAHELKKVFTF